MGVDVNEFESIVEEDSDLESFVSEIVFALENDLPLPGEGTGLRWGSMWMTEGQRLAAAREMTPERIQALDEAIARQEEAYATTGEFVPIPREVWPSWTLMPREEWERLHPPSGDPAPATATDGHLVIA